MKHFVMILIASSALMAQQPARDPVTTDDLFAQIGRCEATRTADAKYAQKLEENKKALEKTIDLLTKDRDRLAKEVDELKAKK